MSALQHDPATGHVVPSMPLEQGRRAWLELYGPGAPYEAKHREAMERLRLHMPTIFGQRRGDTPGEYRIAHNSTSPPYKP